MANRKPDGVVKQDKNGAIIQSNCSHLVSKAFQKCALVLSNAKFYMEEKGKQSVLAARGVVS